MSQALYDCVMFRDEVDMLQGRLEELSSLPGYRMVLVESGLTHRGDPKPLHYAENHARFARWHDKITHVVSADPPPRFEPWDREHWQRDAAAIWGLGSARPDDIVLIADVDEFPPAGFEWHTLDGVVSFRQRLAMYAVDWLYPEPHICTVAARWGAIRGRSLASVRDSRYGYPVIDGGWHLTWLGGLETQREKLAVSCHNNLGTDLPGDMTQSEYDRIWSGACYEQGVHHGDQGLAMIPADVDDTWPEFIWKRRCPPSWFRPRETT